MNLHPLVIYITGGLLLTAYGGYLLHFSLLRNNSFSFYYALANHALSTLLIIVAVLTGFSAEGLVKANSLLLTPHKVMAVILALLTLLSFIYLWIKQRDTSRKVGLVISVAGLVLTVSVILLGWRIRLTLV
ncbi:MAG: hypothetical protein Q9N26_03690 [Aquificota bacterium]|nr:hypothetical protein [Aquificota bacterium]